MHGSKTRNVRSKALRAMKAPPPSGYFKWDGKNQDERPLTAREMRAGMALARKRGRPTGSNKASTTVRFDRDVLEAFRAGGPGWQTRMNAALREWLKNNSPG